MGYTNHGPGALNFLISGAAGLLEFRITPAWATLIYHGAGCAGIDCDPRSLRRRRARGRRDLAGVAAG